MLRRRSSKKSRSSSLSFRCRHPWLQAARLRLKARKAHKRCNLTKSAQWVGPSTRLPAVGRTNCGPGDELGQPEDYCSDRGVGAQLMHKPRAHPPKEACEGRSLHGDK